MPARLSAFFVWALVAASAAFWGLRLMVTGPAAPAHTLAVVSGSPARVDLGRLLGTPPAAATPSVAAPALSSRFVLTGVMAPKRSSDPGYALIAVDGKLPRAFRVGASLDGELVLQSVSLRSASIGPAGGPAAAVLELPVLPPAATGVLPLPGATTPPVAGAVPPVPVAPTPVAPVAPAGRAPSPPLPSPAARGSLGQLPPATSAGATARAPRGIGGALQGLQQPGSVQQSPLPQQVAPPAQPVTQQVVPQQLGQDQQPVQAPPTQPTQPLSSQRLMQQ